MRMVTPQLGVPLSWPHFQLNYHSIKAFWGQMLEDTWALGPFLWACIFSWHNKGSFLTESHSQHWYSADNSGIGWRKGPRIHGRTLDFTSFGMFFRTFVYIFFSPRFVVVVVILLLFKGASQNSELASQSGHFENEILVFSRNLC